MVGPGNVGIGHTERMFREFANWFARGGFTAKLRQFAQIHARANGGIRFRVSPTGS
jgi:hypothetical protein